MKTREEFVRLLNNSNNVTEQVVAFLKARGYDVEAIPNTLTPDWELRWQYTDNGDILIRQRIEVKHFQKLDFRSIDEIPFEYLIIDETYKVIAPHTLTLFVYILVNASRTGCAVVGNWTRKYWIQRTMYDSRENEERDFTLVEKKHLFYMSLE